MDGKRSGDLHRSCVEGDMSLPKLTIVPIIRDICVYAKLLSDDVKYNGYWSDVCTKSSFCGGTWYVLFFVAEYLWLPFNYLINVSSIRISYEIANGGDYPIQTAEILRG